jgi:ATP-binding cassette subfamily C protein
MLVTTGVNLRRLSYERKLTEADGRIEGEVFQLLTGITKIRVAAAEGRAFARWADRFSGLSTNSFRAEQLMNGLGVFNSGLPVIASICIFATLFFGETGLNPGGFISFNSAFSQFLGAGIGMSVALTSILNVIPLYERMKPILNTSPEVDDLKPSAPELTGDIEISSVTFGYKDSPVPVLNDLSLKIRSGEFVALVGASGCGKSTLFRLLLGFEKPQSGTIYYDKQDLDALDIVSVRRQLGVVLQNGKLIPGSIFTNIVGSLPLGQAEVEEAIRMAGMEEDLKAMPMGIHTMISEGASTLSGGQRQRLMIARALASKPRILLFDEATSALDNRTQALVSQSVEMLNVTRLVIAHRLSTIRNADRIIVFDKGRIIESGSYDELVELNGHFMELAKRQLA